MSYDVSVVVPAFNAEATLPSTLDSIRGVFGKSVEVIVVDDGSTDSTNAIARAASTNVIFQTNSGAAVARSRGLAEVQTEFVIFLDSDDQLAPGIIQALDVLRGDRLGAVAGGRIATMNWRGQPGRVGPALQELYTPDDLLREPKSPWPPCAAVWRTHLLVEAATADPSALAPRYAEDYELLVRASLVGSIHGINVVCALYRSFGGKSTLNALAPLESAERTRQYYSRHLGLEATPVSERTLARWASWRLFRGRQAERGLLHALAWLARHPRHVINVALESGRRLSRKLFHA